MTIKEFLQKTVDGKLDINQQKKYLEDYPFGGSSKDKSEEIAEAVEYLYTLMEDAPKLPGAIDLCGTGGSGLPRINTSTISAFVVAGAGVKVAKHGNNAASGRFGSFDLLEKLGIPASLNKNELQLRYRVYNLAFLYARNFHPMMKHFAPVRAELSKPTFFNILGPLLSPVRAKRQLIGTPKVEYAKIIIEVCRILNKERVIVAVGSDGLDDITLTGSTTIFELGKGNIKNYEISPKDFGVNDLASREQLSSGSNEDNIQTAKDIISGAEHSPKTDLVLVNSAAAIYLAGKADTFEEAYAVAKKSLESKAAERVLNSYKVPDVLNRIAKRNEKRKFTPHIEVPSKNRLYKGGLIAEIKKRSPSEGIITSKIDVVKQARIYEQSGAKAISVLCEPEDFGGSFEDLARVSESVGIPVLCKDFIISKEHIGAAKTAGADMVLLIASMLDDKKLKELYNYASDNFLQVLIEVHNESELQRALELKPKIIGINSRNLNDFSIDTDLFARLSKKIPAGIIKVAESGIKAYKDVPSGAEGVLVGTEIMKHPFPSLKIKELLGEPIVKLCGIRLVEAAELCNDLGADMIGINFVPRSKRKVDISAAKNIVKSAKDIITVGVFENQSPKEVNKIAEETGVEAIQLSGDESNLSEYKLPVIKTIRPGEERPKEAFMTLLDNKVSGSGKTFDHSKISKYEPSLIAGGITVDIAKKLYTAKRPLGFDTASGIETDGKLDMKKIKEFIKAFS
ncbi:MAG TPA: anthranilate phosphoribosyltransferase [Candidatus Saccharimonadales bacterium]|nr:anthranilate phosphoribosyltransferase [Candidatus Saccharimonadales bacterium]